MTNKEKFNLKMEQYMLDELTPEEKRAIESKPETSEHIDFIVKSNEKFFKKFDIKKLAKETEEELLNEKKIIKFPTKTITTLIAAAACFIITLNILPNFKTDNDFEEIIYLKGSEKINIYLKEGDQVDRLSNLDKVYEGDQLQITYQAKSQYGIIFSLDGLKNVTFHYPEKLYNSTSLDIGKEVTLPTSYILDNAPHFEKFYMITSDKSFDFNFVKEAAYDITILNGKIMKDIDLPTKYSIKTITLLKD